MNKKTVIIGSALLMSGIFMSQQQTVESMGRRVTPDFLDEKPSGMPQAYRLTKAHPHYNYYKRLMGGKGEPIVFFGTYSDTNATFYSPVATGRNTQYSPINRPEQINRHTVKTNYRNWTVNKHVNTVNQLIDKNKSAHAKGYKSKNVEKKGYMTYAVSKSTNKIETGMFKGKYGEWRSLGYSEMGGTVLNEQFPSEHYQNPDYFKPQGRDMSNYDHSYRTWDFPNHRAIKHINHGTSYDKAKSSKSKEYKIKESALTRFLNERPNFKKKNSNPRYWMNYYSLQNDPSGGQAAYLIATTPGGYYYTAQVSAEPKNVKNLSIISYRVLDENGKEIRKFTRKSGEIYGKTTKQTRSLKPGEKITIETVVKNDSPSGTTQSMDTTINFGYREEKNPITLSTMQGQSFKSKSTLKKGKIRPKNSITIKKTMTVPETNKNAMSIYSEIDRIHYFNRDNTNTNDDIAGLALTVSDPPVSGDFKSESIVLVDKNGKETTKPIPGEKYKIRFRYKYNADRNDTKHVYIGVNHIIERKLPYKGQDTYSNSVSKKLYDKGFKSGHDMVRKLIPKSGETYTFTTPNYITYETGVFNVSGRLVIDSGSENYNKNTANDSGRKSFGYDYDIQPKNAMLIPKSSSHTDRSNKTYLMKFDVDYDVADYVKDHAEDVKFLVNVDGNVKEVQKHIKQGLNKNVTIEIDIPSNGQSKTVNATVLANSDAKVYEANYANNSASTTAEIKNVGRVKPYTGPLSRENSWSQFVEKHSWKSQNKSYKGFNNNKTYTFKDYSNGPVNTSNVSLKETYKIDHVWFRSKTSTDLKQGPSRDGWVDLMDEVGKIKAGYGYELKIEVSYKTDAFSKLPKPTSTSWVRPGVSKPSLPNNIYVQTPDNKIHSVNGDGRTESSFEFTRNDSGNFSETEWTFKIAPRRVLGVNTIGKFYIGEDVSNGTYDLTVFTPKADGILGKMTDANTVLDKKLFDQAKDLKIEIIGSATDDISDHITQ